MDKRTQRRLERVNNTYNFLEMYYAQHGYMPSIRDICTTLGTKSTSTAFEDLKELERQGKIILAGNTSRAIVFPENVDSAFRSVKNYCLTKRCEGCKFERCPLEEIKEVIN